MSVKIEYKLRHVITSTATDSQGLNVYNILNVFKLFLEIKESKEY